MRSLTLILVVVAACSCASAGPGGIAPDGADVVTVPAGTSVKVPLGGRAATLSLQFDAEDVSYTLHAVRSGVWQRISPKQTSRTNAALALGDTTNLGLEGEYHEYSNALGAQVLVLTNSGSVAAEVRPWWTLAK